MLLALDNLFLYSALGGGLLFAVQLVLLFMGGSDIDADLELADDIDAGHAGADASFKLLSLQGITAFIMMFGLVGWAMRSDSGAGPLLSLGVALLAGSVSTWGIAKIFSFFHRLQSSGTLDMSHAVGSIGIVYLTIGPEEPGKVSITVGKRLLTIDAIVEGTETLKTGTPIRVVRVLSDTTVSVERNKS